MSEAFEQMERLRQAIGQTWPLAKGSLSRVHKPCVRPNCKACGSGQKHPVWLFSFRQDGRRRCMYVPEALVPTVQQAIENARKLEALMVESGAMLIRTRACAGEQTAPEANG